MVLVILQSFCSIISSFFAPMAWRLNHDDCGNGRWESIGTELEESVRKLVRFFQRSRDGWKAKYFAKKEQYKLMGNQVRAVEKSRAKWRQAAEQAQQQVRQLQQELEQYKKSPA